MLRFALLSEWKLRAREGWYGVVCVPQFLLASLRCRCIACGAPCVLVSRARPECQRRGGGHMRRGEERNSARRRHAACEDAFAMTSRRTHDIGRYFCEKKVFFGILSLLCTLRRLNAERTEELCTFARTARVATLLLNRHDTVNTGYNKMASFESIALLDVFHGPSCIS